MKRWINQRNILLTYMLICLTACSHKPPKAPMYQSAMVRQGQPRVAVVLGAGGARALAHLGVLKVLEDEGIPIDLIVGSSAGAMIGALYADCPNAERVKEKVIDLKKEDLLDPSLAGLVMAPIRHTGPVKGEALEKFLTARLEAKTFHALKIPLVLTATDIENHRLVILKRGALVPAIHASAALPPLFAPVKLNHQTLVDGGVMAPVPVDVARTFNPLFIIAVDISTAPVKEAVTGVLDVLDRAFQICFYELSHVQSKQADLLIRPNMNGYGTFDDQYNSQLYENGKATARAAMQDLKKALKAQGIMPQKR